MFHFILRSVFFLMSDRVTAATKQIETYGYRGSIFRAAMAAIVMQIFTIPSHVAHADERYREMSVTRSWSAAVSHSGSAGEPTTRTGQRRIYHFPPHDARFGTPYLRPRITLDGNWNIEVTSDGAAMGGYWASASGRIQVGDASPGTHRKRLLHPQVANVQASRGETRNRAEEFVTASGGWHTRGTPYVMTIEPVLEINAGGFAADGTSITHSARYWASGTVTTRYRYRPDWALRLRPTRAIRLVPDRADAESLGPLERTILVPPGDSGVGAIRNLEGVAFRRGTEGSVEFLDRGGRIQIGDRIEVSDGGFAEVEFDDGTIRIFRDDTSVLVTEFEGASAIREDTDANLLRQLFLFTSGFIADDETECCAGGGPGIRGDASEYLLPRDPETGALLPQVKTALERGVFGVVLESASPARIAAAIEVPSDTIEIGFRVLPLRGQGEVQISLGGLEVIAFPINESQEATETEYNIVLDLGLEHIYSDLGFTFDGGAGAQLLLWDVTLNGQSLGDLTRFALSGPGSVFPAFTGDNETLSMLKGMITSLSKQSLEGD